jgi:hypothetical protein
MNWRSIAWIFKNENCIRHGQRITVYSVEFAMKIGRIVQCYTPIADSATATNKAIAK